jgi:hypothetical protein
MRGAGGLAVFIGLLLAVFIQLLLLPKTEPKADELLAKVQASLGALRSDVASGRVVRADIFAMLYFVSTLVAVTPDLLPGYADHFKGKFSVELKGKLADDLIRAIDGAQLQGDKWGADLRWGAAFLDQSGTALHSIYLNSCYFGGARREGYIDGVRVGLNGSLVAWFENNFSNRDGPCVDGPPDWHKRSK